MSTLEASACGLPCRKRAGMEPSPLQLRHYLRDGHPASLQARGNPERGIPMIPTDCGGALWVSHL